MDGARSPEELETLLEDAFVLRDWDALAQLFTAAGVLVTGNHVTSAQSPTEFALAASDVAGRHDAFIAGGRRIVQSENTALIVGAGATMVARRGRDHAWRFAISVFGRDLDDAAGCTVRHQRAPD